MDEGLRVAELDARNAPEARHLYLQRLKVGGMTLRRHREHMLQQIDEEIEHFLIALDEANLHVQAVVLVGMTDRVMFLSPKCRPYLEYSLEHAHHDLLVQLGALGKESRPSEVVDSENIGAAFRRRTDDARRVYLHKISRQQVFTEPGQEVGIDAEDRLLQRET